MTLHELWSHIVPSAKRPLGFIIVLSFLLHAAGFFIFKATHEPPSLAGTARQPRVYFLTSGFANSDNGKEIQTWLDLMNPTLVAVPTLAPTTKEIKNTLFPDSTETWPQIANPLPAIPSRAKPERPADSIGDLAQQAENFLKRDSFSNPMPIMVEAPPTIGGTQTAIEGDLSSRPILRKEAFPQPRASITLRSTELRFSVDPNGNVTHVLIEESSGDSSVDILATKNLSNWFFTPKKDAKADEWGKMTIFWDQQPLATPAQPAKT